MQFKRIFQRVPEQRADAIVMIDTPETAHDLTWFIVRYPLEMDLRTRTRLAEQAVVHEAHIDEISSILDEGLFAERNTFDGFPEPARPPRDYQQQAADLAYTTGSLLLGDEVGLGKTQTGLMLLRDPNTLPALIVVPTNLQRQWYRETQKVMPHLTPHIVTRGTPTQRRQRNGEIVTVPYDTRGADVLIMTYHKLAGWRRHLAGQINTVIFDEVQELRHSTTDKYAAAAAIADHAHWKLGLSATPVYNYGGEIYNIVNVLKPGALGTQFEFTREYGGETRPNGAVVVRNPTELGDHLRDEGILLRRTRAEVGRELPAPVEVVMEVDSNTAATDNAMADIVKMAEKVLTGHHNERFTASGQLDMRLRQATGIDKAPHVAAFIRFLLESESKVVLFGWHHAVYDIWMDELADFNPVFYTGQQSGPQKDAAFNIFRTDPECRVLVCSLRSGAGLDGLQEASKVCVFGELDWSPAMHHQAIGRLARDGQDNEVVAYYLVSEVGSDPVIAGVLEEKRQQAGQIMSNGGSDTLFTAQAADHERMRKLAENILSRYGRRQLAG
jgi:SNF2 family DNA or RNA helicase